MTIHRKGRPSSASRPRPARPSATPPRRRPSFIERYRGALLAGVVVVLVLALGTIVVLKLGPSGQGKEATAGAQPADPAVVAALTRIPETVYDAVGVGNSGNVFKTATGAPPLQQSGKPEVLYVGAEFCPFCAAERWAMIAALSRFGTFSNLHTLRSSTSDIFPGTPTFTFYQARYESQYVAFTPVEQFTNQPAGNGYTRLEDLSSAQQSIVDKFDRQPFTPGGIPFVDFGGKYVFSGATYGPGVLAGLDWQQIVVKLADPSSAQSQGIIGSANMITAATCQLTGQQPATVCSSAGVQKAAAELGKG